MKLFPRSLGIIALVACLVAGASAIREKLPPAIRELIPVFHEKTKSPASKGTRSTRPKGGETVSNDSRETYWPGLPVSAREKLIKITHTGHTVGYSTKAFSPAWAAYAIKAVTNPVSAKRPDTFMPDPALPVAYQVSTNEYTRTGYDRGHMAPNWAVSVSYGREAQIETFYTSNIAPQEPELNRGIWEALERIEANDYARRYDGVVCFDGPIYDAGSTAGLGKNNRIRIPGGFFKIIVRRVKGQVAVLALILPQSARGDGKSLSNYLVSVNEIERKTGLDFLTALPAAQQAALESTAAERMW
ncbi:MAG: endonuclease [Chthoniobacteraceae bacterium]|nr:endonuclease [Chthoniobacteraceae bacterium]